MASDSLAPRAPAVSWDPEPLSGVAGDWVQAPWARPCGAPALWVTPGTGSRPCRETQPGVACDDGLQWTQWHLLERQGLVHLGGVQEPSSTGSESVVTMVTMVTVGEVSSLT